MHAIIVSIIATSLIKLGYGINDIRILIAINVLVLVGALYAYIRNEARLNNQEKHHKEGVEAVINKFSGLEKKLDLIKEDVRIGKEKQTNTILDKWVHSEEKLVDVLDKHFATGVEQLEKLTDVSEQSIKQLVELTETNKQSANQLIDELKQMVELSNALKESSREQVSLLNDVVTAEKANVQSMDKGMNAIQERFEGISNYHKEMIVGLEQIPREIHKVINIMFETEKGLSDNITGLSDDLQKDIKKLNHSIGNLGDDNRRVAEDYLQLWKDLSSSLGDTALNNQQFLILLQDHYKALKQVAVEM